MGGTFPAGPGKKGIRSGEVGQWVADVRKAKWMEMNLS